jgi:6-O-methylguanine DNA methyltransferase, DNA binding domain
VIRVSPGWVETDGAVGLVKEIARQNATDYEGGRKIVMDSDLRDGELYRDRPAHRRAQSGARCGAGLRREHVVKNDGALSGYRWGVERKRALLEKEAQA